MMQAEKVSFQVDGKTLLSKVSLSVEPGKMLAIIGPNGAGKSTFLKLLSGEHEPSDGKLRLATEDMATIDKTLLARRRSVVVQHTSINFPFTLLDIIAMGRYPHPTDQEADRAIVEEAMHITQVTRFAHRVYSTLSGGEQQRGQLARAIAQIMPLDDQQSRYMLLDEPIANMDLAHQHTTLQTLRSLCQKRVGVAIVLHDINLAAIYADQIAVIAHGQLHAHGTPVDTITSPLMRSVFELEANVMPHPQLQCPMVVPLVSP